MVLIKECFHSKISQKAEKFGVADMFHYGRNQRKASLFIRLICRTTIWDFSWRTLDLLPKFSRHLGEKEA